VIPLVVLAASVFTPLPFSISAVAALATGALPYLYVDRKRSKRLLQLERQLPEVAGTIGRALRAGHSFPSAVGLVGTEFPEPMAGEFRITFDEINYGVPFNEALLNLAKRVPIGDLRYFVIAVMLLTVCIEAGLSLDAGIMRVAEEIELRSKVVARELELFLLELRSGFSREKACAIFHCARASRILTRSPLCSFKLNASVPASAIHYACCPIRFVLGAGCGPRSRPRRSR
jgi:Flp pilus assembly protein TadB